MRRTKISIITITLNSEPYLEQTITSVLNQSYDHIEYIVIDGGSTDGTLDIIHKYEDRINHWISEPDKGIADAMNKGLTLATGDFILFLHSDDYLVDKHVLSDIADNLSSGDDIFLFNIFLSDSGKTKLSTPRGLNWWINIKTGVYHQSAICAKPLFERLGYFDTNFQIAMDYDFFLRAYRAGVRVKKINQPLSVMRLSGISSQRDWPSLKKRFAEEKQVHNKNCSSCSLRFLYFVYWSLYPFYRYIKS